MCHQAPIQNKSTSRSSALLEVLQLDVLGPVDVQSIDGSRQVTMFIWFFRNGMRNKSDSFDFFKNSINTLVFKCKSDRKNLTVSAPITATSACQTRLEYIFRNSSFSRVHSEAEWGVLAHEPHSHESLTLDSASQVY